ncbi:LMBR1-like membrane protein [Prunus dulcis]|uniref:LMBR1-like membrane protein n=1 Tax=Prunus dulcis TaxID=3755 RepID=A0A4Y1RNE8_PRUDU|nr:LMBR1-like membrane protein [Prunus dulcis]
MWARRSLAMFCSPLGTPGSVLSPSSSLCPLTSGRTVVPLIQGFEDAGDFTVTERLKTSVHVNLLFYLILELLAFLDWGGGAFLLGFGLSEIPKGLWKNSDWTIRQKVLSHKIAKMAVKLDDAHQDLSNAIVVAQATSTQMSKRDPLRPYMDIIDNLLAQMFKEDPSFKPQGGRLGENDMDYDTDEKSMATLRRHLRGAREEYYRYKSEYMTYVMEALELEDTIKNYERRNSTGWMVARYAPPVSYNFLNLIRLGEHKTIFEKSDLGLNKVSKSDRTLVEMKATSSLSAEGAMKLPQNLQRRSQI